MAWFPDAAGEPTQGSADEGETDRGAWSVVAGRGLSPLARSAAGHGRPAAAVVGRGVAGPWRALSPKGGFDSIYLAWDSMTALAEVQAIAFLSSGPLQARTPSWVMMNVDGMVSGVLDLTDSVTRTTLGTNEQEITGSWQTAQLPPTQLLAQVAFDSGKIVGIKYPSTKNTGGGVNLVVFPDRLPLNSTDYLEVYDPHGSLAQRIGA
jgi:RES domain-containing protein